VVCPLLPCPLLPHDRDRSGDDAGNGGGQPEFVSLDAAGVESIDLNAIPGLEMIDGQSVFARGAIRMKDGSTRQYADTELNWSDTVRITLPDGSTKRVNLDAHAAGTLAGGDWLDGGAALITKRICLMAYRPRMRLSLHSCPQSAANDPEYRAAA